MKPCISSSGTYGSLDLKDLGVVHFKMQMPTIYLLVVFAATVLFSFKASPDNSTVVLADCFGLMSDVLFSLPSCSVITVDEY